MTDEPMEESGMVFGPYQKGHCFRVERSGTYARIGDGVRMAEFILLKTGKSGRSVMWIVEAKSSSPQRGSGENFVIFIDEIKDKFINAFALGWASCLRRHREADAELPAAFREIDLEQVDVKFVLVIDGHKEDWLAPLRDALEKALRATQKTWAFSPQCVVVLNEEGARRHRLIASPA